MPSIEWLKDHSFIAGWLSPTIALIGILIRGGGKKGEIDWPRAMLYISYLTCLAAVFTPLVDDAARMFAGFGVVVLSSFFMFDISDTKDRTLPPAKTTDETPKMKAVTQAPDTTSQVQ
jgi:hypothetical protein